MMLKAMINHRLRRCTVFLCTFLLVSYAGFSAAAPPEFAGDKGFPQYVEGEFDLVKQMLEENAAKLDRNADMMEALSTQLSGVEANLKAEIVLAKREINAKVDLLAQDVEDVLFVLNEPDKDIELTTEVCFDVGTSWDWVLSTKASLGVGWDIGFKGDAFAELSGPGPFPILTPVPPTYFTTIPIVPAVSAGVGGTLCVNVPLYSVASNGYWDPKFDTKEFDDLIARIAAPAQGMLPGLAHVYGKVMPDVTPVVNFLDDGLNLIIRDEGLSDKDAFENASQSFVDLMNTPMLKSILEQSHIDDALLDKIDPLCFICWAIPH